MLDLFTEFGGQYRITFDPACGKRGKGCDPAYMQIPGRFGTIYPDGDSHLRVDIDGHVRLAAKVGQIPGCVLVEDGDIEKTYRFPLSAFEQVALIVKPRKRRHHSDARRQQALADLARARAVLGKDSPRGSCAA